MNVIIAELLPVAFFVLIVVAVIAIGSKWGAYAAKETKHENGPIWKAYFISAMPAVGCFAGGIMAQYGALLVNLFWILACACIITTFIKYYNLLASRQ